MASSRNNPKLGKDNHDQRMPIRRNLRHQIPYVESLEEQASRELWETLPFCSALQVVDTIIGFGGVEAILTPTKPSVLSKSDNDSSDSTATSVSPPVSGYEDSFDILYKREKDNNVGTVYQSMNTNSSIIGTASIASSPFVMIPKETRKEKKNHFCLIVAYRGEDFCGWQTQLDNVGKPSVQLTLEEWLTELQNDKALSEEESYVARKRREKQRRKNGRTTTRVTNAIYANSTRRTMENGKTSVSPKIRWANIQVAGRTDRGVSAIGQMCRYRTFRKDLTDRRIKEYLNSQIQNSPELSRSLRVTEITQVSKAFHPTFVASCRAYAYLIDIGSSESLSSPPSKMLSGGRAEEQVTLLDGMLRALEGKSLDYIGLSYGKISTANTMCTLYHARARVVEWENHTGLKTSTHGQLSQIQKAVCIELVGDRFLRRMVRLLVGAALRVVAITDFNKINSEDALLKLVEKRDRTLAGRPAPPDGLIFVGARLRSKQ